MKKIIILLIIPFMISSCCSCRKGSPIIGNLEETTWKLTELNNNKCDSCNIQISFDKYSKTLNGSSNCNIIFAGYHLFEKETGNIEFVTPGLKEGDCTKSQELKELVELLKVIRTVKIESGHLLMADDKGDLKALFEEK